MTPFLKTVTNVWKDVDFNCYAITQQEIYLTLLAPHSFSSLKSSIGTVLSLLILPAQLGAKYDIIQLHRISNGQNI